MLASLVTKLDCCLHVNVFRYYINYKLMKKKVKQYGQQLQQGEKDRRRVLKDFSKMLDDQVMILNKNLCKVISSKSLICFNLQNLASLWIFNLLIVASTW
jgi:hypothetical protein